MVKSLAALCVCSLFFGGCVHPTRDVFTQHYTLGGSTPTTVAEHDHPATISNGRILHIPRIDVPPWLESTAMYYRLDYSDGSSLAAYGHSDWVAPPATMLEPIIQRTLAGSDRWRAVIGPHDLAAADASLHLRLDDFSQAFSQPRESTGVIDATATLIDNHDDSVIAQRHFHVEVAAPTPDAPGGARALAEATRQLATRLRQWLQPEHTSGRPAHQR